jgi:hypothetical protein
VWRGPNLQGIITILAFTKNNAEDLLELMTKTTLKG